MNIVLKNCHIAKKRSLLLKEVFVCQNILCVAPHCTLNYRADWTIGRFSPPCELQSNLRRDKEPCQSTIINQFSLYRGGNGPIVILSRAAISFLSIRHDRPKRRRRGGGQIIRSSAAAIIAGMNTIITIRGREGSESGGR